ncbi:MAG: hypothetical protein HY267_05075 [Deltaproteobacteria bacterium]|nr:hypothetical protein [Deltaproteobacteria bacterium]
MNVKKPEPYLGPYERDIQQLLKCSADDAIMIEHIMRDNILHTVALDWLSARAFNNAARKAVKLLEADRADYEAYFASVRAAFEQMKAARDTQV